MTDTPAYMRYAQHDTPEQTTLRHAGLPIREQSQCNHPALAIRANEYKDAYGYWQICYTCLDCHAVWNDIREGRR